MAIRAESFKNWCAENISPQSWVRIVLKSIEVVRKEGMTLKELENPHPELELPESVIKSLSKSLEEIYDMRIEENMPDLT